MPPGHRNANLEHLRLKHTIRLVSRITFALILLMLVGCQEPESEHESTQDGSGRLVALPDTVERIVTMAPNLTEIVFAAGAGDRIVAVTTADDYPPEVESIPRFSALPVDFEAILQASPDLVLAAVDVNSMRDVATLEAYGLPVYAFAFRSVDDVFDAIETTGAIVGTEVDAAESIDALRGRLQRVRESAAGNSYQPRTLVLIGLETLYSFGGGSYVNEMIAIAGGESVTAEIASPAPILSDEFVLDVDPDVIVVATSRKLSADEVLDLRPAWRNVRAIENRRVYTVDPDFVLRPGPRVVDGIESLNKMLSATEASAL